MSTNLAETMPLGLPEFEQQQPRHIEIVSSRSQRRARPRPIYALVIVGGLFALFIAQLLMSIVVSNGAYQISSLQGEQRTLTQTQQALSEKADLLASPQNLTAQAKKLGMGSTDRTPAFLVLGNETKVIGKQKTTNTVSLPGVNRVPNSLLDDKKAADKAAKAKQKADAANPSTPASTDTPSQ